MPSIRSRPPSPPALPASGRRPAARTTSPGSAGKRSIVVLAAAALIVMLATVAPMHPAHAQTPRQSQLVPADQSRPQARARAALRAGEPARALEITDIALKTFPTDAQLRFVRAVALNQLNRLPEAEAAFVLLIQEYPDLPEPYNNLAVVRAAQGRLDEARAALEEAIRAVPDYAVAHENLGDILIQLAVRSYQTSQRLDPGNRTVAAKLKSAAQLAAPAAAAANPAPPRNR